MKTASDVADLVKKWIADGKDKSFIVVNAAEACMGWPYVWGAVGADCNPSKRAYYAERSVCPAGERTQIYKTCQYYTSTGEKSGKSCGGCTYYPDNMRTLCNDCQGFCKNIFSRVGITLPGAGATSMYADSSAFTEKGKIANMPNVVCLVFMQNGEKMSHVGIHVGDGQIIHCSGTVKRGKTTDRGWREYVTVLQTMLIQRGYSVVATGADGKYGTNTFNAVKQFQKDSGLVADGICGKNTWCALESGEVDKYTVTIQHVSKTVAESIVKTYGGVMTKEG